MFCNNCGFENSDESLYCTKCGKALSNESADSKSTPEIQREERPTNYFVLALLSLFFCTPFGVVSMVYSTRSDIEWNMNRPSEAKKYSDKARNWAIWSIALGALLYFFCIVLCIIAEAL